MGTLAPIDRGAPPIPPAAGFVSRLAAFVVDVVVLGVCSHAVTWTVDAADALLLPAVPWERGVLAALLAIGGAFAAVLYFAGLWSVGGRTVGQLLLGLRVVPIDGGRMTIRRSLVRFVGYVIAALPLYAGFLWVLVHPARRGWHDLLAGTTVVYDPPLADRERRARERSRSTAATAGILAAVCVVSHGARLHAQAPDAPSETEVTTVEAAARDLSTPQRSLAAFLETARDGEWESAAASLDLREVPRAQRAAVGEQAARDLEIVLSYEGVVPASVPDEEEPGGDRAIELVRLPGIDQGVVLRRVSAGAGRPWLFSAGTVRAAGELRSRLARGPIGERVPEVLREPHVLGLEPWQWLAIPIALLLAVLGAWLAGRITTSIAGRIARRIGRDSVAALFVRLRPPVRSAYALAILGLLAIPVHFPQSFLAVPGRLYVAAWFIVVGWSLWRIVDFVAEQIEERAAGQEHWRARQVRTRASAVRRVLHLLGVVLAIAVVLLQIEPIRELGVSILASAGVAGIVLGIAAQRTIGNLIAGIQLSFTQPLRVGDQVVVQEEFGTVEEITLSYVVLRLPDHRRLVLPIATLLETPFENWTRLGSDLIGTVVFPIDFTTPVETVRAHLSRYVRAHPRFDGETFELVVAEIHEHTITLRVLVSAVDAAQLMELRCAVREFVVRLLQELDGGRYLPRQRVSIDEPLRPGRALRGAT